MPKQPIFVTRPSLPPLEDLIPYLEQIWESKVLTNNGPFHRQLEDALCNTLMFHTFHCFRTARLR